MRLKIKWNDDRVKGAATAILLIGRERIFRGETVDLIQAALAEYRDDPQGYKQNKAVWAGAQEMGPLTNPAHIAYYTNLRRATDALLKKIEQGKRQFNSLLELDNWLVDSLKNVR